MAMQPQPEYTYLMQPPQGHSSRRTRFMTCLAVTSSALVLGAMGMYHMNQGAQTSNLWTTPTISHIKAGPTVLPPHGVPVAARMEQAPPRASVPVLPMDGSEFRVVPSMQRSTIAAEMVGPQLSPNASPEAMPWSGMVELIMYACMGLVGMCMWSRQSSEDKLAILTFTGERGSYSGHDGRTSLQMQNGGGGDIGGSIRRALSAAGRSAGQVLRDVRNGNWDDLNPIDAIILINVSCFILITIFPALTNLFLIQGFNNPIGFFLSGFCCISGSQLLIECVILYFVTRQFVQGWSKDEIWSIFIGATLLGAIAVALQGGYYMGPAAGSAGIWATFVFRNARYPLRLFPLPQPIEARWIGAGIGALNLIQCLGGLPSAAAFCGGSLWAGLLFLAA